MKFFQIVFTVRVVYKSGYFHDFDCTKFTITNELVKWELVDKRNKPIKISVDEIESVWQVNIKKRFKFSW